MRLKGLRVVHRPKSKEGGEAADGGDDSLSSNSEEELAAAVAPTGTEAKRKPHNQQYRIKSAPARLPVSSVFSHCFKGFFYFFIWQS